MSVRLDADALKGLSVSHGTMRDTDLLRAFGRVLEHLAPEVWAEKFKEEVELTLEAIGDGYHDPEDENQAHTPYLLEEMIDALDSLAPERHYFGTHTGDGSDFGFWEVQDLD